ncbi:MAG TPA: hypothetical protein VFF39_09510 [Verrucomicrobiae bacterium]|jgi:hypothetical protein|nr:hypothetical protein [Verrucomicrobiae bacterium]
MSIEYKTEIAVIARRQGRIAVNGEEQTVRIWGSVQPVESGQPALPRNVAKKGASLVGAPCLNGMNDEQGF